MFRVIGALTGSGNYAEISQEERSQKILSQAHDFEVALQAMDYVLDDHPGKGMKLLEGAENSADGDDRSVSVLARGVIEFLEATLGFESSVMKKAAATLAEAQQLSQKRRQYFQKINLKTSSLYPPGTEYAVTFTEACLLHALLMLFSESMVESAKALFKLRKAYHMLQEVLNDIKAAKLKAKSPLYAQDANESFASFTADDTTTFNSVDLPYQLTAQEQHDRELMKLAEDVYHMRKKRLQGAHIGNSPAAERLRTDLGLQAVRDLSSKKRVKKPVSLSQEEIDKDQATIDEFIHSGVNLCFGILQVVLSLIPPAIGAVLSVVGFHGSREEGLRMIWRSSRDRNIHGGIGLLSLLFYYDGPFQFTDVDFDIPPTSGEIAKTSSNDLDGPTLLHPGKKLEDLLLRARAVFPNGALWLLQEARMLSSKGRPQDAVDLMDSIDVNGIEMKQVKALMIFDRAMILVNLHKFERAAEDLLSLLDVSEWSHSLYTYFAGCCYLEMYRMCQMGLFDDAKMAFFKERARELIFGSPELAGRKKFMAKNMPLERFMLRKVGQFQKNQTELHVDDPLDAIGTSPVHELMYFYNGYNRMTEEALTLSHTLLTTYKNPMVDAKDPDQELLRNLLVSLTLRRLGKLEEGCELLDKHVLPHIIVIESAEKFKYIRKTEDPWAYPTALYERALFTWKLKGLDGLKECQMWITRAQNYADDYELSTRIGMTIKAAHDRLQS
ncbi:LANO_0F05644g1_1 [Lachancea nothofagi CBS 11611]|uniref:LANO_0F05644g1_1 n=1 Tax=Lachancea nothofagi CBS 11611 TaxID=1266666 RepID=A0A1G4K845_9SACH|nr:LANO_0F05644g1_1 [Lachancea nothofagi CBS 11611]